MSAPRAMAVPPAVVAIPERRIFTMKARYVFVHNGDIHVMTWVDEYLGCEWIEVVW